MRLSGVRFPRCRRTCAHTEPLPLWRKNICDWSRRGDVLKAPRGAAEEAKSLPPGPNLPGGGATQTGPASCLDREFHAADSLQLVLPEYIGGRERELFAFDSPKLRFGQCPKCRLLRRWLGGPVPVSPANLEVGNSPIKAPVRSSDLSVGRNPGICRFSTVASVRRSGPGRPSPELASPDEAAFSADLTLSTPADSCDVLSNAHEECTDPGSKWSSLLTAETFTKDNRSEDVQNAAMAPPHGCRGPGPLTMLQHQGRDAGVTQGEETGQSFEGNTLDTTLALSDVCDRILSSEEEAARLLILEGADLDARVGGFEGAWQVVRRLAEQPSRIQSPSTPGSQQARKAFQDSRPTGDKPSSETDGHCTAPTTSAVVNPAVVSRTPSDPARLEDDWQWPERERSGCWQHVAQHVFTLSPFLPVAPAQVSSGTGTRPTAREASDRSPRATENVAGEVDTFGCGPTRGTEWSRSQTDHQVLLPLASASSRLLNMSLGLPPGQVVFSLLPENADATNASRSGWGFPEAPHPREDGARSRRVVGPSADGGTAGICERLLLPIVYRAGHGAAHKDTATPDAPAAKEHRCSGSLPLEREANSEGLSPTVFCYPIFSRGSSLHSILPYVTKGRTGPQTRHPTLWREARGEPLGMHVSPGRLRDSSVPTPMSSRPRCNGDDFLGPVLQRRSCLEPAENLFLLFAFSSLPASFSGLPASLNAPGRSYPDTGHGPVVRSCARGLALRQAEDAFGGTGTSQASPQFPELVRQLLRQVLPSLPSLHPHLLLDVLSSSLRLSRLSAALQSTVDRGVQSGEARPAQRRSRGGSLAPCPSDFLVVLEALLPRLLALAAPQQSEGQHQDVELWERAGNGREFAETDNGTNAASLRSAEGEDRPALPLKSLVTFISILNTRGNFRLPEQFGDAITTLTDYCCARLQKLFPVDVTNLVCALSPKHDAQHAAASDEFSLFLLAKFIQERPDQLKPEWLALVIEAYTRAGLEDSMFYEALSEQVKRQFSAFTTPELVTILSGFQKVRFRDQALLTLAYASLEEGARRQMGASALLTSATDRGVTSDTVGAGSSAGRGGPWREAGLPPGAEHRHACASLKSSGEALRLPSRSVVEMAINTAGLLDVTEVPLQALWRLYVKHLRTEVTALERRPVGASRRRALIHDVSALLPQMVLQQPEEAAELIDIWLRICEPVCSGELKQRFGAPAQRHRLLCEAHELGLLAPMPASKTRTEKLKQLDEALQRTTAQNDRGDSWAPESSTFHVDVASALLSLNVRYEAEVRVAKLFILDLIVALPGDWAREAQLASPRETASAEATAISEREGQDPEARGLELPRRDEFRSPERLGVVESVPPDHTHTDHAAESQVAEWRALSASPGVQAVASSLCGSPREAKADYSVLNATVPDCPGEASNSHQGHAGRPGGLRLAGQQPKRTHAAASPSLRTTGASTLEAPGKRRPPGDSGSVQASPPIGEVLESRGAASGGCSDYTHASFLANVSGAPIHGDCQGLGDAPFGGPGRARRSVEAAWRPGHAEHTCSAVPELHASPYAREVEREIEDPWSVKERKKTELPFEIPSGW
ncbi:conserved hypothetical protein [Neospora caninum Liverpool]|uniref:Uncharacterized protein n=1 Tax=Neospora caninum (strain Liverpool) TaxID=572307 RepID=F0VLC9_NEOCL|nr:conserved hypothetical protein [Neospora caninum Liverpool]CBZ54881.1 conserved hypothetical protein [Neospora caninum Liverpool]CEL69603.1 TPA: hypothetical protein BN1204_053060 [Neospora caninum Liverpool]|eukprot:XP_003884909.1 conserved hypothetical protein [Neospora caninum Liverpool]